MNIIVPYLDGEKERRVTMDPYYKRIVAANDRVLDLLSAKIDWSLSKDRKAFQQHVRDLLNQEGIETPQ